MSNLNFKPPTPSATPVQARVEVPDIFIPTIRIPQPDGSLLIRAGKPVLVEPEMGTMEFSRLTHISREYVIELIQEGRITARRMSPKERSHYLIPRSEAERFRNLES